VAAEHDESLRSGSVRSGHQRHESRRIDNQLPTLGRQGDRVRVVLSLVRDDLMRLFNAAMVTGS